MNCPVYKILGNVARKYFCGFQLGSKVEDVKQLPCTLKGDHNGMTQVFKIDGFGVICLDLRSERTRTVVCGRKTYDCVWKWLTDNSDLDHVLLVLSIPIVYNDFSALEKAISTTGLGKELEDDLRDHWRTLDHQAERTFLLENLLNFAEKGEFRITIFSGDVHIGCAGVFYDKKRYKNNNGVIINSLVSSAVVNVPPPVSVTQVLDLTGGEIETVKQNNTTDIKAGLYRFFSDSRQKRYLPGRNYLELAVDTKKGIQCRWFCEGDENVPYELYINAYQKNKKLDMRLIQNDFKYVSKNISSSIVSNWFKK